MVQPASSNRRLMNLAGCGAERFGALFAGADAAEMVVSVDAGGMTVGKRNLNRVIPYLCGGFRLRFGLEHGQRGRRCHSWREGLEGFLFAALVVAGRARAFVAQVSKIVVARVAVGPDDVHTSTARNVNLDASWLFSRVEGSGHFGRGLRTSPFRRSSRQEEWDCRVGRFSGGQETCRCAHPTPD